MLSDRTGRRHVVGPDTLRWGVVIAATAGLGCALASAGMSAAYLIAGLLAAGVTALIGRQELAPSRHVLRPSQGLVGVAAAAPLTTVALGSLAHYLAVSALCVGLTLALCLLSAYALWRIAPSLSPATAVLSTLAGGASGISTMAPDLDVDHRYVALSQYLRLIVVTLTLPGVLLLLGHETVGHGSDVRHTPTLAGMGVLLVLVVAPGFVGRRLRLPAPFLLAPLVTTLVISLAANDALTPTIPAVVSNIAYAIIGWQAGGAFARGSLVSFARLLPITCVFIATVTAGCCGLAWIVAAWTGATLGDAYLATTPGGIYAVLAFAHDSGAGSLVTTLQVVRLLAMLVTAVAAAKALNRRRDQQTPRSTPPEKFLDKLTVLSK